MKSFLPVLLALTACQAVDREGPSPPGEEEARAPASPGRLPPLEPALAAAIAATAPYEVPGRPCLARRLPQGPGPTPERRRRQREIQSVKIDKDREQS
jgi:hypothetical protein